MLERKIAAFANRGSVNKKDLTKVNMWRLIEVVLCYQVRKADWLLHFRDGHCEQAMVRYDSTEPRQLVEYTRAVRLVYNWSVRAGVTIVLVLTSQLPDIEIHTDRQWVRLEAMRAALAICYKRFIASHRLVADVLGVVS
jgi:hypothetical protein